jgi:pimeloyl-ACP methyl ester carboxylesterase
MTETPTDDLLNPSTPAFADVGNGITLCYETFGDASAPTLLLIMGLGGQMFEWRTEFCEQLAAAGFHVVRFDNRDAGLSTFVPEPVDVAAVVQAVLNGDEPSCPYLLSDMATDALRLLDHLGVRQAHVVGLSLGGMIAQTMAIEHGERVSSMTSLMSRTGDPDVGLPSDEALAAIIAPPSTTRDHAIETSVMHSRIWGGAFTDEADVRAVAAARWDRQAAADGTARQFAAIIASGSRVEGLRTLSVPTLVIHGSEDTLIQPDGGVQTADVVPGSRLLMIEGMGHELSRLLWPQLVEAITRHAMANSGAAGQAAAPRAEQHPSQARG